MKYLKKITISNARRFGKDVEIELSPKANIFLAPNGTGKTTIFEAIEFALTGSIQRLASPPLSLIRENQDGVDVRLDFENGKFCEANYRKGQEPILSGNHDLLFSNKYTVNDIPFLLRLTHLIEQRGNNWFIQKGKSSEAGDLLDKLSIGKDLSAIFKTKANTRSAATKTINDKKEKRDTHLLTISSFEAKLKERDAAKLNYILTPLDEILNQIQSIHTLFSEKESIDVKGQSLDAVISYRGLVNAVVIKSEKVVQLTLLKLSNIESQLPLFHSNKQEIEEKQKQVSMKEEAVPKIVIELNNLKEDLLKLQEQLHKTKDIHTRLKKSKQLSNKKKEEELRLTTTEGQIKLISDSIPLQKEKLNQENELIEKLNAEFTKFNLIRQREEESIRKQGELTSLQSIINDWNVYLRKTNEVTAVMADLKPLQEKSQKAIENFQAELTTAETKLKESQAKLSALKNASEAILSAVGIIAANIPEDQGNCPVCNAIYEPFVLKEKIALALQEIDPVISKEINIAQGLQQAVEEKKQQIRNEKIELEQIVSRLAENEVVIKSTQAFINEECLPKFSGKKTVNEAEEWLKKEKNQNDINIKNIATDKSTIEKETSSDELNIRIASRDQIVTAIQSLETNLNTLTLSIENIKTEIDKISTELSAIDLEQIDTKINAAEKEIERISTAITDKSRAQEQTDQTKKEIETQIIDLKMNISKLQGQQNEILTQWKEVNLPENPSIDKLSQRKETLIQQTEAIKKSIATLDKISEELARWRAAEKFEILNREIKMICGNREEEVYLSHIKEQGKEMEQELNSIVEKKKALDLLYNQIKLDLDAIHEQIKSINPLWVSLLKRIVVNPRFVDTHLDSYSYHNKPQAEVLINLHEERVSVMDVASEAQATDLQLTFMLSMASRYKWTQWKSLLLDDPTQHHDLVHAAGVFDLLRDYIIDQDFQVLMGTHDSVQGKFFQRKLQNENVDVKLWRLIANDDGVTAEEFN
jgi:exonuclease SbcC